MAGPVVAATRAAGVPDAAILELTWSAPALAAAVPGAIALERPAAPPLPFADAAAGAVVLVDPPAGGAARCWRKPRAWQRTRWWPWPASTPSRAASAGELAPAGWAGHEAPGPGDLTMALARAAAADPEFRRLVGVSTIDDRERWLELFATGALGADGRRLWVWKPDPAPAIAAPAAVGFDPDRVQPWVPVSVTPPRPERSLGKRARERARRDARVAMEHLRIRSARGFPRARRPGSP